ncbi:MAG: hypothetical protein K2K91_07590 [Ruminococcus sp.]|nr:hypothetical protein [Ruminococcus sp.]MDE7097554.1 hypothetical protein [Ruminococcus sp.]
MDNNIMQFQSNDNFIERISADENLTILVKTWNNQYYSIIFNEYCRVCIYFNIPVEIGKIELIMENDCEQPDLKGLSHLIIRDPWDEEVIFSAYIGNYVIKRQHISI